MDSTIKQNEELLEQVADLIATHVKEQVQEDPEPDMGEIEQGMRQLLQEVGRRALGNGGSDSPSISGDGRSVQYTV